MKIEIKGSWHNRKLLIDGKDVTNNCESVQIDVRGTEPVRTTLVFAGAEVEAETSDDTDTYTRKSLIAGDRMVTNIKLKKRSGKNA